MNVFDFDGTLYHGDSTFDFCRFCLKKDPKLVKYSPTILAAFARYTVKRIDKTQMKEMFYRFLRDVDTEPMVEEFWQTHKQNIYPWYAALHEEDDIVISASPEFLLKPICQELGIHTLMASRVDPHTGEYTGINCHGQEKVRRLEELTGVTHVDRFYSDSQHDLPLARIAYEAFLVDRKGNLHKWEFISEKAGNGRKKNQK